MANLLYPPSVNNLSKSLNANYTSGAATITLNNTTSIQNKPGACIINRVDTNGNRLAASGWTYIEFTGTSGATLTGCSAISGDQDHATGEVVEFVSDVTQQQRILDVLALLATDTTTLKVPTLAGTNTFAATNTFSEDQNLATGKNITVNSADPWRTITLTPGFLKPTTTAGCASVATVEAGTNDIDYDVLDFDTATDENAFANFQMPDSWDGGVVQFRYIWTAASGSGTVVMELSGRSYADDDAIDQAVGTPIEVLDTLITAGDVHISAWSGDVTLTGAGAGEWVHVELMRDVSEDNLGVDARIMGVQIRYKQVQYSD